MKTVSILIITILCICVPAYVSAQVPGIINYQGRVAVGGTNFDGTGSFKFALVDGAGSSTYWSNGVNTASLTVTKGLYSVLLGDTSITNMDSAIPTTVFTNADVRLRVWFDDGVSGLQLLGPDQRLAAAGYAMIANVANGVSPSSIVLGQALNIGIDNTLSGTYASIAGGSNNTASGAYAFVGGGADNIASDDRAIVAGGGANVASGPSATVGGGTQNTASTTNTTIAGGSGNIASGDHATVAGGEGNAAIGDHAFVGGGAYNIASDYDVVGGGESNIVSAKYGTVHAGFNNQVHEVPNPGPVGVWYQTIGGGNQNNTWWRGATIAGGEYNTILSNSVDGTIGGGGTNTIQSDASYATISGGGRNTIQSNATYATIGGGGTNTIQYSANNATIGGGWRNTIQSNATYATIGGGGTITIQSKASYATVGGGGRNTIWTNASYATIGGGGSITIQYSANNATIGGGGKNTIQSNASYATIGGGGTNAIQSDASYATISGGVTNTIQSSANYSTIGGGEGNLIQSAVEHATIGGGEENTVSANLATIPGGHHAAAPNYAQMAYSSGLFANLGDSQFSLYVVRGCNTNNPGILYLDGQNLEITLVGNRSCSYTARIVGRDSVGNTCAFNLRGGAKNVGGTVTVQQWPFEELMDDWGAGACTANIVSTGNPDSKLRVQVSAPVVLRWTATVETAEVAYP